MSFRLRMIFSYLAVGIIPLILAGIISNRLLNRGYQLVSKQSTENTNRIAETLILENANVVAGKISEFLATHPELDPANSEALMANADLALLAIQPVGNSGSTIVYNTAGLVYFDQNDQHVGLLLANLYGNLPEYWNLLHLSFGGTPIRGYYDWEDPDGKSGRKYFTSAVVANTDLRVAATTYVDEFYQLTNTSETNLAKSMRDLSFGLLAAFSAAGVIILVAALVVSNMTASPLEWLANFASQFLRTIPEAGKIYQPVTKRRDEIGILNNALNFLTQQVREEFEDLEKQVTARTAELTRRTGQLETAAQVARESAAILDIDKLLNQTAQLISDRFGYYHVGIFLVDDLGGNVVFFASNSPGGRRMLERNHKLKIGQGVVGITAEKREPRLVADVTKDTTYSANPDLAQTRSELALPLQARERLIGVLDVQSMETDAYSEEDIRILQILTDQLALAIENSRLFTQSQQVIRELEGLVGQQVRQTWSKQLGERSIVYSYDRLGNQKTSYFSSNMEKPSPDNRLPTGQLSKPDDLHLLSIPIRIQQLALGKINLRRDPDQPAWSEEDRQLAQEAAKQIASALENARLLEEIRLRAQQESMVSQIAAKTQLSMDLESVLKTAVQEIGLAMNARRVSLRLGDSPSVPSGEDG